VLFEIPALCLSFPQRRLLRARSCRSYNLVVQEDTVIYYTFCSFGTGSFLSFSKNEAIDLFCKFENTLKKIFKLGSVNWRRECPLYYAIIPIRPTRSSSSRNMPRSIQVLANTASIAWGFTSQPSYGPEVYSSSNRTKYQKSMCRVKGCLLVRLTTSLTSVSRLSKKCAILGISQIQYQFLLYDLVLNWNFCFQFFYTILML
jgi:hypothetical protein